MDDGVGCGPATALDVHRIVIEALSVNCYVVAGGDGDAVVIDPGGEPGLVTDCVAENRLRVHAVLATHAHHDHVGAASDLVDEYGVPFCLHPDDGDLLRRANFYRTLLLGEEAIRIPRVDAQLVDGAVLHLGALRVEVVHTPGHTPGCVCFEIGGGLFTGDTIMAEGFGRTDLPGGDRKALDASVARLTRRYAPTTALHPGHGEPVVLCDATARSREVGEWMG